MYFEGTDIYDWTAETTLRHIFHVGSVENTLLGGIEYRQLHNEVSMWPDDYSLQNGEAYFLAEAEVIEGIWGFFMQDEIRPIEKLVLNLGLRYDIHGIRAFRPDQQFQERP